MTIHFKYSLQKINSFFMKFCHIFIITIHIFNNLVFSLYYFGCSNLYFRFRYGFTCCINKRFNFYNFTFLEVFTGFGNVQKSIYNFNFYDLHCAHWNASLSVFITNVFLELGISFKNISLGQTRKSMKTYMYLNIQRVIY